MKICNTQQQNSLFMIMYIPIGIIDYNINIKKYVMYLLINYNCELNRYNYFVTFFYLNFFTFLT